MCRRRNEKTVENVEHSDDPIATDKSDKKEPPTTSSAVFNIYVTDDDIRNDAKRSPRAAPDVVVSDDGDVTENYDSLATSVGGGEGETEYVPEMTDDCGMMGYDMPRPTNVYDEIAERNPCSATEEDHEYESLDEVIARVSIDKVIA